MPNKRFINISIISCVKNVSNNIQNLLYSLSKIKLKNLEIIIIDDFSDDDTYNKIKKYSIIEDRIILIKNTVPGKVNGLNLGYKTSSGKFIHMIDGDDLVDNKISYIYQNLKSDQNFVISSIICDYNFNYKINYMPNVLSANKMSSYRYLSKTVSFPKWVWILNKDIAKKIFPIPQELPYEDLWISMIVKIYGNEIKTSPFPYYYYIQHSNQTYGGILNFDANKLKFRGKRNVIFLNTIISNSEIIKRLGFEDAKSFKSCVKKKFNYYNLLSEFEYNMYDLFVTKLFLMDKLRLLIFKYFNSNISFLNRLYWSINRVRNTFR